MTGLISMPEMADAGEYHGYAETVCGGFQYEGPNSVSVCRCDASLAFERSGYSAPVSKFNEEFRGFAICLASSSKFASYAMYVAQVGKRSCATPAIVSFAKDVKCFPIQIVRRFDAVLLQFKVTRLIDGPGCAADVTAFTEY